MGVARILRLAAAFAVGAIALSSAALAQPAPCTGRTITSVFGQGCATRANAAPLTDHDYGYVHIEFSPPASVEDVVRERDLQGTWLQGLLQRTGGARVTSAVVLLDIRAVGGDHVDGADPARGVPLAIVPLAAYQYDGRRSLQFSEQQEFANRDLQANLLISRGLNISTTFRVVFSNQNVGSLVASLRPVINASAALGGHGFVVNNSVSQGLMTNLAEIESTLRSPGNTEVTTENRVDLSFDGDQNRLDYQFQLNPRAANRPKGMLIVELRRRPSLFTSDLMAGQPGQRLPDYHVDSVQDSDRIWIDGRVAPGISPAAYVRGEELLRGYVTTFQDRTVTEGEFDRVCSTLRERLTSVGLSRHDRAAVFWAAFAHGASAERPEIQNRPCIIREREEWTRYGFVLPNTIPPRPPVPSAQARDRWLYYASRALADTDPATRNTAVLDLFAPNVMVTIAPGTLYDAADPVPPPGEGLQRTTLVRDMKALNVGCRFGVQNDAPRFNVLARRIDTNQVLTLTIDYGGRTDGSVEITGLRVRPTTEEDWAALDAANDPRPQCRSSNRDHAPNRAPS